MLEKFKKSKMVRIITITTAIAILCSIAFAVTPTASTINKNLDNRLVLMRDIVKLSIVVMANQTPINADEAKTILPVLKDIRQQGMKITEEQAKSLDIQFHSALSANLEKAVTLVRLPEMDADVKAKLNDPALRTRIHQAIACAVEKGRITGSKGHGLKAFNKLIDFFELTASNK